MHINRKIDVTVTHEKIIYQHGDCNDSYKLENAINTFKEELRNKVADIIKSHAEELTDDEAMIDKLLYEVKKLTEELQKTKGELASANQRINQLELNKNTQPYQTYPQTTPNTPLTGITWETFIGDQPDWMNRQNMSTSISDGNVSTASNTSEYREKNPKRYG